MTDPAPFYQYARGLYIMYTQFMSAKCTFTGAVKFCQAETGGGGRIRTYEG